jgi:hypothetical protein
MFSGLSNLSKEDNQCFFYIIGFDFFIWWNLLYFYSKFKFIQFKYCKMYNEVSVKILFLTIFVIFLLIYIQWCFLGAQNGGYMQLGAIFFIT